MTEDVFYLIEDSVDASLEVEHESARVVEEASFNSFKVIKPKMLFNKLFIFNREIGELLEDERNEKI